MDHAFGITSTCTLKTPPVWNATFGADWQPIQRGAAFADLDCKRVVYIGNGETGFMVYAFDAASGTQLWDARFSRCCGSIGTAIANGMVYVSSSSGTITAWAPQASAKTLRKTAVNRPQIPTRDAEEAWPLVDLRGTPTGLFNFWKDDR